MKPTRQPYLMFALLLAFAPYLLAAPSGNLISYQGRVVDANGVPLADGNYSAAFRLYVDGAPTSFLETLTVAVKNGVFTAYLGGTSALPVFETTREYQLGVKVGAGAEVKQAITSVPLAHTASSANTAATVSDGAVTTAKLADGTATTAKIADGAVTNAKINSVAASKVTGQIGTAQITNAAVTGAKIALGAVDVSRTTVQQGGFSVPTQQGQWVQGRVNYPAPLPALVKPMLFAGAGASTSLSDCFVMLTGYDVNGFRYAVKDSISQDRYCQYFVFPSLP